MEAIRKRMSRAKGAEITLEDLKASVAESGLSESAKANWIRTISSAKKASYPELDEKLAFEIEAQGSATQQTTQQQGASTVTAPTIPLVRPNVTGRDLVVLKVDNTALIKQLGYDVDKDGAVMKQLELKDFKRQVLTAVAKVSKIEIQKKLLALSATQDAWSMIKVFIAEEESLSLIAMCAAALVLSPEDRSFLMDQLGTITVLQGRTGKVQKSLTNLAGFIGLACAKDNTSVQRLTRFVPNPLLEQPARELQIRKLDPKTNKAEGEEIISRQKQQYQQYVDIHKQTMAAHAQHFKDLPVEDKLRIKIEVETWFLGA